MPTPTEGSTKSRGDTVRRTKFIFVTGGVMSGLGKGVTAASIARLLQLAGLSVTCVKIDPYLNVDAGTMNPVIHGEVFVTDDGGETDMDLGTYERMIDQNLTRYHNITTGQVYRDVIEGERRGDYLGRCVQIIPHVTDGIKKKIRQIADKQPLDVIVVECGGTVGDIEGLPFLEAFRQIRMEEGSENTFFVHVTLAPILEAVGEQKTKPTQHSVQELRRIGIQPDLIVVRCKAPLTKESKMKISLFTSVEMKNVISNPDTPSVYAVPHALYREGIVETITTRLGLGGLSADLTPWEAVARSFLDRPDSVRIAMVGKYVTLADSYVSVNHALDHAGAAKGVAVKVDWVDSEEFERNPSSLRVLEGYHGLLIPGGFGKRGSEGKILAADFARRWNIPYLGLCFGFQLAIVAFARHVCSLGGANSEELDPATPHPVVHLLPEQQGVTEIGATMRLGGHDITVLEDSLAGRLYGKKLIRERHRHRYELNQKYRTLLESKGIRFSGFSDGGRRAEILEIPSSRFYFATQFHPEFISRPDRPEPAYLSFIEAALERRLAVLA